MFDRLEWFRLAATHTLSGDPLVLKADLREGHSDALRTKVESVERHLRS